MSERLWHRPGEYRLGILFTSEPVSVHKKKSRLAGVDGWPSSSFMLHIYKKRVLALRKLAQSIKNVVIKNFPVLREYMDGHPPILSHTSIIIGEVFLHPED